MRAVVAMGMLAAFAAADTVHVDASQAVCPGTGTLADPFCAVQDGIDAAMAGDTVLVAPGTYVEAIDFLGKAITVVSSGGPDVTALAPVSMFQRVSLVSFVNGEGPDSVIEGFTLADSGGTEILPDTGTGATYAGGGVLCLGSSPTIRGNLIRDVFTTWGGGIYSDGGSPRIENNILDDNTGASRGGGAHLRNGGDIVVTGNTFVRNLGAGQGGGLLVEDCTSITVLNTVFEGNTGADGGGIKFSNTPALVEDCEFRDNLSSEIGAGIFWIGDSLTLRRSFFTKNSALDGAGLYAAGTSSLIEGNYFLDNNSTPYVESVFGTQIVHTLVDNVFENEGPLHSSQANVIRNVFKHSTVYLSGGTFTDNVVWDKGGVSVFNTTVFARNTISSSFAPIETYNGNTIAESCIVRSPVPIAGSAISFVSSNVEGGVPGPGNIDVDPLFVDAPNGDFSLQSGSPCIDAGLASDFVCGADLLGNPRRLDGTFGGASRVDMGAIEFSNISLDASVTGSDITITTSGTAGLNVVLVAGFQPGLTCLEKFGTFFIDFGGPFDMAPVGMLPSSIVVPLPAAMPPIEFELQAVGIDALSGRGNTSNVVHLVGP